MFTIDSTTQKVLKRYPMRAADIAQSFDSKQIESKYWLKRELTKVRDKKIQNSPLDRVEVIGGWYGHQIIPIIRELFDDILINFYEVDETAIEICKNYYFPLDKKINYKLQDATNITFSGNRKLIICTSCEHMKPLNIESGIVLLQSNNYTEIQEHINCVKSYDELNKQYNIKKVFYEDELDFDIYKRFMVIGRV